MTKAKIIASCDIRTDIGRILIENRIVPREIALDAITMEDAVLSYYNEVNS